MKHQLIKIKIKNIDFVVSVVKDENPVGMDMSNQMQDFLSQLHQMSGQEIYEETAEDYSEIINEYNEGINAFEQSGFNIGGRDINIQLEVYNGEVKFWSDTDAGSSAEIAVK